MAGHCTLKSCELHWWVRAAHCTPGCPRQLHRCAWSTHQCLWQAGTQWAATPTILAFTRKSPAMDLQHAPGRICCCSRPLLVSPVVSPPPTHPPTHMTTCETRADNRRDKRRDKNPTTEDNRRDKRHACTTTEDNRRDKSGQQGRQQARQGQLKSTTASHSDRVIVGWVGGWRSNVRPMRSKRSGKSAFPSQSPVAAFGTCDSTLGDKFHLWCA